MGILAKYLRLSSEDGDLSENGKQESNSIVNQRNLLDAYIRNHAEFEGMKVIEFCDDGWSGKNFERPAVQEMLEQVRQGNIQCIIVKDLSRFGRDYLEVGNFISRVFPFMGVRFVAVNDGFDSIRPLEADSLETSFKTLLYDLYSRDLSRKVRSAKRFRANRGDFLSPFAPYGYVKDPKNHSRLLIDPEAAGVVRRIFRMAGDGISTIQIAKKLNQDGVLTPMRYKREAACSRTIWPCVDENNFWTDSAVIRILRDERYLGNNIYGKRVRDQVGHIHTVKVKRSDWIISEATHEGILTKEEFDRAADNLRKLAAHDSVFHDWPLGSKVRCGVCGHVMTRSRKAQFYCRTPVFTDTFLCPTARTDEQAILDALLDGLHAQAILAVEAERIWNERRSMEKKDALFLLKQLADAKEMLNQRKQYFNELYESYVIGEISRPEYFAAKATVIAERDAASARVSELNAKLENAGKNGKLNNRFVSTFQKYAEVTEMTREIATDVLKSVYIFPGGRLEINWNYREEMKQIILDIGGQKHGTEENRRGLLQG